MDSEDVVVDREHVESVLLGRRLRLDRNLCVVDSGEVASTSWLVLFWLEGKRVRVDTWHWGTRVVVEWLDRVEVLTALFLESVLTVEDQLERVEWTSSVFREFGILIRESDWRTDRVWRNSDVRDRSETDKVRGQGQWFTISEVPQVGAVDISTPDQFLNWVVVRQSDLLLGANSDRIGTSVLHLLDEVFVTLLRESSALFGVKVDVVAPDLESLGRINEVRKVGGQVNVQSHFVVLQGNQWQRQSWVAVEEEDEWQVKGTISRRGGRHLTVVELTFGSQVQFRVQSPPLLVVLIDSLATDGQFNVLDSALRHPRIVRAELGRRWRFHFNVHVSDQITVSGDSNRNATRVTWGTVDGLFDVFHREVGVAFVNRLEESDFWVTSQVDILGAIGDELHETTGHFVCLLYYTLRFFFRTINAKKHSLIFPGVYKCLLTPNPKHQN